MVLLTCSSMKRNSRSLHYAASSLREDAASVGMTRVDSRGSQG